MPLLGEEPRLQAFDSRVTSSLFQMVWPQITGIQSLFRWFITTDSIRRSGEHPGQSAAYDVVYRRLIRCRFSLFRNKIGSYDSISFDSV